MRQTGAPVWLAVGRKPMMTDEPYALIGHVRICEGSGGQPLLLPGSGAPAEFRVLGVRYNQKMLNCIV
jgi:hypothetical protein